MSHSEIRYPYWFSSKPFALLPGLADATPKSSHARHLRIKQIISHSNQSILDYADRLAIGVDFGWASEIIPFFETIQGEDYVTFTIWPGNTKGQGHHIYNRESLYWQHKPELEIQGKTYPIEVGYHMKFSHFNRYITALDSGQHDLLKQVNTKENFYLRSGKKTRVQWEDFEAFLDEHFKPVFDWRNKCDYNKYFVHSDRTYFTVSIGFVVDLYIPLSHIQHLDKSIQDDHAASAFIDAMVAAYHKLLD